jgi:predicted DNA-binding transcriptional regulator AlpA
MAHSMPRAIRAMKPKKQRKTKKPRLGGSHVVYPRGLEARLGISAPTRWRMERDRRLPPRDVYVGGTAVGWRPATLDAAESTPSAS